MKLRKARIVYGSIDGKGPRYYVQIWRLWWPFWLDHSEWDSVGYAMAMRNKLARVKSEPDFAFWWDEV